MTGDLPKSLHEVGRRRCARRGCGNPLPVNASPKQRFCRKCKKRKKSGFYDGLPSTDALRHRLPGSFESGKRR